MPVGQWVLLAYRLPREPSTPRIALWRALRRLGVGQLTDDLVALPADSRTREQFEWLAARSHFAGRGAVVRRPVRWPLRAWCWLDRSRPGRTFRGVGRWRSPEDAVGDRREAGAEVCVIVSRSRLRQVRWQVAGGATAAALVAAGLVLSGTPCGPVRQLGRRCSLRSAAPVIRWSATSRSTSWLAIWPVFRSAARCCCSSRARCRRRGGSARRSCGRLLSSLECGTPQRRRTLSRPRGVQ